MRDTTRPLHPERRTEAPFPKKAGPAPVKRERPDLQNFRIGGKTSQTAPPNDLMDPLGSRIAAQPMQMDRKAHTRMKRGKLAVEARLDLHGMTLEQAQPRLNRFILDAHASGKRLVLVITGKGKERIEPGPIPMRRGVLKHQVPQWLKSGALRPLVLQIAEAHKSHGGTGAYYVYLRRNR